MKLYLSSYRLGRDRDALRHLVGHSGRAGIVLNALDLYATDRSDALGRERDDLAKIGFEADEIDLRSYFASPTELRSRLESYDIVWVVGGNTFVLARAMAQSHFNDAIHERLLNRRIVYAGYSAGVCVIGPDLDGCHLMDDPHGIPDGYSPEVLPSPLGWIPWRIVPHYRSDHPESPLADLAVNHLLEAGLPFQALRDGQAFVLDGEHDYLV